MIVMNGVIGLCIFIGGITHHEMSFRNEGTNSALAVLTALALYFDHADCDREYTRARLY